MRDLLRRHLAPVSDAAWIEIEKEATHHLKTHLSARRVVDFNGPYGWDFAAVNTGGVDYKPDQVFGDVGWAQREVMPLVEVRRPFFLNQFELDNVTRGSADSDLGPVQVAAKSIAVFEEKAIYLGFAQGGIDGILSSSSDGPLTLPDAIEECPKVVEEAVEIMRRAGIGGPYALTLGPTHYRKLIQTTATGYPSFKVVSEILGGPVSWSEALDGGVVLSQRGGDFELTVGQDFTIGYLAHDKENVELYLTESFAFRVLEPAAAVPLAAVN